MQSTDAHEAGGRAEQVASNPYDSPRTGRPHSLPASLELAYKPIQDGLDRVREDLIGLVRDQGPMLTELLEHVLGTKGKRIRPAITLLASMFHPGDGKRAETMASAVELLHVATLIHDDTVDNSDTRRGKATVSALWGQHAAVLLGDYVFATSATFACDTGNIRVIRRFSETIMDLSSGELMEMRHAFDPDQTREQYLKTIYDKTAALFTTSAESGGVLSDSPEEDVQELKAYGYNTGMAFQIVDDILDFRGQAEEVGKPVGSDLAQGILTLPAIMAMEGHPGENPIRALFQRPEDEGSLRLAVEMIQEPSNMEKAYAVAEEYSGKALAHLSKLAPIPARDSLEQLADYVLRRRS